MGEIGEIANAIWKALWICYDGTVGCARNCPTVIHVHIRVAERGQIQLHKRRNDILHCRLVYVASEGEKKPNEKRTSSPLPSKALSGTSPSTRLLPLSKSPSLVLAAPEIVPCVVAHRRRCS